MRTSTSSAFDASVDSLVKRQAELADSQTRLTTGKRVMKASDDPAAAARAERALASMSRADTSQRAVDASRSIMGQTENAMADAGELLQQARETLIAAGNATYSNAERLGLSNKLKAIRDQLFSVSNRSDGAGSYLFGGQGSAAPPFVDGTAGATLLFAGQVVQVQFAGVGGQITTEQSTGLPLSTDGGAVWLKSRTGNGVFVTAAGVNALSVPPAAPANAWIDSGNVTDPAAVTGADYTVGFVDVAGVLNYEVTGGLSPVGPLPFLPGKAIKVDGLSFTVNGKPVVGDEFTVKPSSATLSVFDTLDKAVAELARPMTGAQLQQSNSENLRNVDAVMGTLQSARAMAGEVLSLIDNETDRLGRLKLSSQTERSAAEDLDLVQAISDFQNRQSGYDAALKSYAMVQRMSLFQYISA